MGQDAASKRHHCRNTNVSGNFLMTKIVRTITIVFLLVSCNKPKANETSDKLTDSASILTDTVLNLTQSTVDIDTISEQEFRESFQFTEAKHYNLYKDRELMNFLRDSREFWRKKKITINNELKTLEIWGHPLSYKVLNENIIRVTTITEGEAENKIIAITFNRNYERIGTETLTSVGGDTGELWRIYGEFVNDSTFIRTNLSYSSEDSVSTRQSYNRCLRFKANGQIEEMENCR